MTAQVIQETQNQSKTLLTTKKGLRIFYGIFFLIFGLNGFIGFLPTPQPTGAAATFMGGLAAAGYFFPLLKATELLVGLALLTGKFVPLALIILAPISLNIFLYHVAVDPAGAAMGVFVIAINLVLAYFYRDHFKQILQVNAK